MNFEFGTSHDRRTDSRISLCAEEACRSGPGSVRVAETQHHADTEAAQHQDRGRRSQHGIELRRKDVRRAESPRVDEQIEARARDIPGREQPFAWTCAHAGVP